MRQRQVRGSEPEREGPEPGERAGRDAQGRREPERNRAAAQGSAGQSKIMTSFCSVINICPILASRT